MKQLGAAMIAIAGCGTAAAISLYAIQQPGSDGGPLWLSFFIAIAALSTAASVGSDRGRDQ